MDARKLRLGLCGYVMAILQAQKKTMWQDGSFLEKSRSAFGLGLHMNLSAVLEAECLVGIEGNLLQYVKEFLALAGEQPAGHKAIDRGYGA